MSVEKRISPKPVASDCFTPTYIDGKIQHPAQKKKTQQLSFTQEIHTYKIKIRP